MEEVSINENKLNRFFIKIVQLYLRGSNNLTVDRLLQKSAHDKILEKYGVLADVHEDEVTQTEISAYLNHFKSFGYIAVENNLITPLDLGFKSMKSERLKIPLDKPIFKKEDYTLKYDGVKLNIRTKKGDYVHNFNCGEEGVNFNPKIVAVEGDFLILELGWPPSLFNSSGLYKK